MLPTRRYLFFEEINKPKILSDEIINKFSKLDEEDCKRKGVMVVSDILELKNSIKTSTLKTRRGAFVVCAPQHYYEIQEID